MENLKGIDLDQYRTQAKELVKLARSADPAAVARIRAHHPEGEQALGQKFALADAQLVLARELGFESWPRLKTHLEFLQARAALDAGDMDRLCALVEANPKAPHYRCSRGEPYAEGYFKNAILLWHIAGNPDRAPIPPNILEIARVLLTKEVPPEDAQYTAELILTSRQASQAKVAVPLLELLIEHGYDIDLGQSGALVGPIFNVAPETAEALVARGTPLDFLSAAGLGRMDYLEAHPEVDQETLDEALLFATYGRRLAAVQWLVARGAKGDVLTPHSHATALHTAVSNDDPEILELLLAHGTRANVPARIYQGTALGWAIHGEQTHLIDLISAFPYR
jgi:peptide-methionine (S)-S-oxide reductase